MISRKCHGLVIVGDLQKSVIVGNLQEPAMAGGHQNAVACGWYGVAFDKLAKLGEM